MEELLGQDAQPLDHVEVGVGDAEPDALGVQAAVTHEVADQLGELRRDHIGYVDPVVTAVVGLVQHRQRHLARFADHRAELHRN